MSREHTGTPAAPNLLFLFADQMRDSSWGIGCTRADGDPEPIRTPHLDALRHEGVYFQNCISNVPVCVPYRAQMLTGCWPFATGVVTNACRLPDKAQSIADVMGPRGYACAYLGKWHLQGPRKDDARPPHPNPHFVPPGRGRHGFDDYWLTNRICHRHFAYQLCGGEDDAVACNAAAGLYCSEHVADQAVDYLKHRRDRSKPFCFFVSFAPPHQQTIPGKRYGMDTWELDYGAPKKFMDLHPPDAIRLRPNVQFQDRTEAHLRSNLQGYYGGVCAVDAACGRILDTLKDEALEENTIVVFTSDHGDMLGSHGTGVKQLPWEESIRVPFLLRYPGRVQADSVEEALFSTVDIMPTLLELCGIPVPDQVQGRSFAGNLMGGRRVDPESVPIFIVQATNEALHHGLPVWRGVRTLRYTYAVRGNTPWLLLDNAHDPYQQRNLVHDRRFADILGDLDRQCEDWMRRIRRSPCREPGVS